MDDFKFRLIDQPSGWLGGTVKPDWPIRVNPRLDPLRERPLDSALFAKDWLGSSSGVLYFSNKGRLSTRKCSSTIRRSEDASFKLQALKEEL
jgi:hypothetical protein